MANRSEGTRFDFVGYDGSKLPEDPNVRSVIRRRAMRNVASTRKRRKNYGKRILHSSENVQVDHSSQPRDPAEYVSAVTQNSPHTNDDQASRNESASAAPRLTSNEAPGSYKNPLRLCFVSESFEAEICSCFSVLSLISPLAGLHLGISTLSSFTLEPTRLGDVFRMPLQFSRLDSRKLLSFVPARYGKVSSLTHVTDCLIARLQQIILPSGGPTKSMVLQYYLKAIAAIQVAIDDDDQRMSPETLCAVQLLGIFEACRDHNPLLAIYLRFPRKLLNSYAETRSWICHVSGTTSLIHFRGVERFQTDFERSLFMAHVGPIVTEAFLNNKTCFLTEHPWSSVMRDAIDSDPSIPDGQHDLIYKLWSYIAEGPNLFKFVTDIILSPIYPSKEIIDLAIDRIYQDHETLERWLQIARERGLTGSAERTVGFFFTPNLWSGSACPRTPERLLCPVLYGTFLMCFIIKARLLSSLSPLRFQALERRCQILSEDIMQLHANSKVYEGGGLFGGIFMSETLWVAKATQQTKMLYEVDSTQRSHDWEHTEESMIEGWKFQAWCTAMGREVS